MIDGHRIYLTEGEKAADLLLDRGVMAVCPPCGATKWSDAWTELLIRAGCHELIVLADNDVPGKRDAEIVAASAYTQSSTQRSFTCQTCHRALTWLITSRRVTRWMTCRSWRRTNPGGIPD